jgi:hypothetical protein
MWKISMKEGYFIIHRENILLVAWDDVIINAFIFKFILLYCLFLQAYRSTYFTI